MFSQTWRAKRLNTRLLPGEVLGNFDSPLSFSLHESKSFWKMWATIERLLGEKEIRFEKHTKIPGTFKTLLKLLDTQRMASKCQ